MIRFYKDKYLIALYDSFDMCIGVYDNVKDLNKVANTTIESLTCSVGRVFNGLIDYIFIKNKKVHIYFIELTEQEKKRLQIN